jgi:phosphoesterase RecJ-like protein
MSTHTLDTLALQLRSLKSVLICSHVSPDPDAIGSSCGLALGLRALGVDAEVYLQDGISERVLPLVEGVVVHEQVPKRSYDGVVAVDTAARRRVGELVEAVFRLGEKSFNIDHHISNDLWAEHNFIDPSSASTAEIVFHLLKKLSAPISAPCATLLFAGVMDDTGSFRFANTNAACLVVAAQLIEHGAEVSRIADVLYHTNPLRALRLKALALSHLQTFFQGRVGMVVVTNEMLEEAGAVREDAEGLVDEVRSVAGVLCAVFIRELDDRWKVSLRSKSEAFDVNEIAATFGGGGHKAASGFVYRGVLAALEKDLLERIEERLQFQSVS